MLKAKTVLAQLALSTAALAIATPALAQDIDTTTGSNDIVVTAQRDNQTEVSRRGSLGALGEQDAADIPFSIKSYNAALILNQQPQTLGQVLENDPSIRTSYGFGNAAEQFVVRGFVLAGDDVGFDGLYGIAPRQLIAPELYENVQVLNGASAFLNGAAPSGTGAGGSVNLIPKRASARPLTRLTGNFTSGQHFGGAFDVARRSSNGDWGLRVNGAFRSGDVSVRNEFRQTAVVGGALDYQSTTVRLSLDLAYQRVRIRNLRPKVTIGSATIPTPPKASHNYGQAFSYTTLRDIYGIAKGEWDVAENATVYASFGARDGMEDGIYDGITVTNAATGAATGNALYVPRTDNNEAATAGIRIRLGNRITHQINFGGSHIWQVNRNAYDFLYGPGFAGYATNLYTTPQIALPSSSLVGGNLKHPFAISRTRMGSAFASDTIGLFDDRVLVTAGLRLQTIDQRNYSYTNGKPDGRYNKSAVTPVLGVVVKPATGVSLFANRIESLSAGETAPLTALDPADGVTKPVSNAGAIFEPYKTVQYEIGSKVALGPVNASLALFSTSKPIGYVLTDVTDTSRVRFDLFGTQRNRGIEFSIDGELTTGLRLIAGASLTNATFRNTQRGVNSGNKAVGVPDYTANANVEWDLPFVPGFTLTGRVVQTGKQMVNVANTLSIPEWTRVDLGARYVALLANKPVTFRFNVDNVANKRYWASAYDAFSQALLQGAPRTFKASASIDF